MKKVFLNVNGKKLQALFCENSLDMMRGIMFKQHFLPHIFKFPSQNRIANSIHSFFCVPFYAIFLDEGKKIVDISTVQPFSFKVSKKPCKYLVEISPKDFAKIPRRKYLSINSNSF